ncbi:ATP-binding cassette domain-containing protein [Clostridium ihumii]|uniref:ATP-binding cassette domain-containing protein n=1 Tax=Clostridium ihumii TaxID=1470356 RepID=UPI003D3523D5
MGYIKNQWEIIKINFKVNRLYCLIYGFMRIIIAFIPAFYVLAYSKFIDNVLNLYEGISNYKLLLSSFLWITVLTFIKYLSISFNEVISNKIKIDLLKALKLKIVEKKAKLKYELIENKEVWDLVYRTSKGIPDKINVGFVSFFDLMEIAIKIFSVVLILGNFSKTIAVIVFICFIPIIIVSIKSGKNDYSGYIDIEKIERKIGSYEEILTSKEYAEERKIFNYTEWFSKKCKDTYNTMISMFLKFKIKFYMKVKITSFIITSILFIIIFLLMNLTINKVITIGLFTSMVVQLMEISNSIAWQLSGIVYKLTNSNLYMNDYLNFYNLEEITCESFSNNYFDSIKTIEFKNVNFKYPGNSENTLKNLNLKLENNENYAIVGENGAGKSTITKLLLKLYDNYEGEILINGIELKKIKNVTSLFAVVFQDYAKYEISIRDNILFGDNDKVSEKILYEYFNSVNFNIEKKRFDEGLDTELGRLTNKNTDMSIGQWQKLAMVRSLCEEGSFYILDEPTAALDPVTETIIYKDFIKILSENPAIIITHRLGAAKLTDKIIVIKDGTNVEFGSHDELMSKESLYRNMYENQSRWYIDEKSECI